MMDQRQKEALDRHITGNYGEDQFVSCCPACGDPIDYCQGHGEIGDPTGHAILEDHDRGDHQHCHLSGCEEAQL